MKKDTHPQYFPDAKIKCACGNSFSAGSTKENLEIEICNKCHPFYTGKAKLVDAAGRIEKFKSKQAKKANKPKKVRVKKLQKVAINKA